MRRSWLERTREKPGRPSADAINEQCIARLKVLEEELCGQGIYLTLGAELEFFVLNKKDRFWRKGIDLGKLKKELQVLPFFEYAHLESAKSKYEAILGSIGKTTLGEPCAESMARQLLALKKMLPEALRKTSNVPALSFEADGSPHLTPELEEEEPTTAAGLHMNISAADPHGNNRFYSERAEDGFSRFAEHCARQLLRLQRQGLILYAPLPESYERYIEDSTPAFFDISHEKEEASVTLRNDRSRLDYKEPGYEEWKREVAPRYYRIEDRLAGADANPVLVLLSAVGAVHCAAATQKLARPFKWDTHPVVKDPKYPKEYVRKSFGRSALWREVAGEGLYRDLVRYFELPLHKDIKRGY